MVIALDKRALRELARERRRQHASDPRADFAAVVEALPAFREAASVAVYLSFGGEADTPVVRSKHGDSSGVRGAAWLWN